MLNWYKLFAWIKQRKYLFSWDDVPGNDSDRLRRCLKDDYDIGWVKSVEIQKSDYDKTIVISMANKIPSKKKIGEKGEKATLKIVDEKGEKATLKIGDSRTHNLYVKRENGKLKIYKRLKKNYSRIKITFNRVCDLIVVETFIINISLLYIVYTS